MKAQVVAIGGAAQEKIMKNGMWRTKRGWGLIKGCMLKCISCGWA